LRHIPPQVLQKFSLYSAMEAAALERQRRHPDKDLLPRYNCNGGGTEDHFTVQQQHHQHQHQHQHQHHQLRAEKEALEQATEEALLRVEAALGNTVSVAGAASAQLAENGDQLQRVRQSVEAVDRASARSHKLLSRFSLWRSFGWTSSRAAGRRGQKTEAVHANYRREQKRRLKQQQQQQQQQQQKEQWQQQEPPAQEQLQSRNVAGGNPGAQRLAQQPHDDLTNDELDEVLALEPRTFIRNRISAANHAALSAPSSQTAPSWMETRNDEDEEKASDEQEQPEECNELPEWMKHSEREAAARRPRPRRRSRAAIAVQRMPPRMMAATGAARSDRIGNEKHRSEERRLDRINGMVHQLSEMSSALHQELQVQHCDVHELDEATTAVLKSAQEATARAEWHVRRC